MAKFKALRPLFYQSRMLQAGAEFEPMPGDVQYMLRRGRAEVVPAETELESAQESAEVVADPEPDPEPSRDQLLVIAAELGIELPAGYVRKDVLIDLINAAGEKAEGGGAA